MNYSDYLNKMERKKSSSLMYYSFHFLRDWFKERERGGGGLNMINVTCKASIKMFWLRKMVGEFSYSKFITDIYSELGTDTVVNI